MLRDERVGHQTVEKLARSIFFFFFVHLFMVLPRNKVIRRYASGMRRYASGVPKHYLGVASIFDKKRKKAHKEHQLFI